MGRPHLRWREMHQSARSRIMEIMRSLPHSGTQRTSSQARTASSLKASTEQNHWGVARKMIGCLQRQQWGIGVDDVLAGQQRAAFPQPRQDDLVGLGDVDAAESLVGHHAVLVHGHGHADVGLAGAVIALADEIVVGARSRGQCGRSRSRHPG